jgi:hypothetical protein
MNKYKAGIFSAQAGLLALFLAPMSAQAIEGIDRYRILEITTVKTDTAYSTATIVTAVIVGGALSVGAAVATGGLSAAAEVGAAGVVLGATVSVGQVALVVGSAGAGMYGTYAGIKSSNNPDNLIAQFRAAASPTNSHYIQNTHGSTSPHDMEEGHFIRPPAKFGLNVFTPSGEFAKDTQVILDLIEYDSGSANDDLGSLKIHSFAVGKKAHPELVTVDPTTGISTYVNMHLVSPPKHSEDDSEYLVTYSIEKNAGTCDGLSMLEKMVHRNLNPKSPHHCI